MQLKRKEIVLFSLLLTSTRQGEGLCIKSYENSLGIRVQGKREIGKDDVSLYKVPTKYIGMMFAYFKDGPK